MVKKSPFMSFFVNFLIFFSFFGIIKDKEKLWPYENCCSGRSVFFSEKDGFYYSSSSKRRKIRRFGNLLFYGIYLLDIELSGSSKSGYDISREIRQNAHDWKSVIIVCSVYNLKESFISARLAVLTYLSKLENFPINLKETFKIALGIFYQNDAVQINEHQKIYYHDILYALKEKYSKYCIIQTMDKQIRVRKNLKDLESELKLKKIKKHILANEENILSITHQEIVFKNKDSIKIE